MKINIQFVHKAQCAGRCFLFFIVLFFNAIVITLGAASPGTPGTSTGYPSLHDGNNAHILLKGDRSDHCTCLNDNYSLNWESITGMANVRISSDYFNPDVLNYFYGNLIVSPLTENGHFHADIFRPDNAAEHLLSPACVFVHMENLKTDISFATTVKEPINESECLVNSTEGSLPLSNMMLTIPSTPVCSGGGTICAGSSINISATSAGATTIYWYTGGVWFRTSRYKFSGSSLLSFSGINQNLLCKGI